MKFFQNIKVSNVYAGSRHSLALTANNEVYAWGKGEYGQLGNGMINDCAEPTRVKFPMSPSLVQFQMDSDCEECCSSDTDSDSDQD
jgi:alpha-tubulin suppressor-like RCC1 family protein